MKFYKGDIQPDDKTVFVFGSNPEGRHGAGSAKVAVNKFGAIYGQGEGLQGQSYGLPTKDLRIKGTRSISESDIVQNIEKMYQVARSMPDKDFKIAYRNGMYEKSLNGYTGGEMLRLFIANPVPNNIWFSNEWQMIFRQMFNYSGCYVNHSGGAKGSDTMWGEIGAQYGVVSEHYWHGRRTQNGNHELTDEEFEEGKEHVLFANKTLNRRPWKYMDLLARNYMQVKYADEIFGIGRFKNKTVDGGTGWAVQMAIDDGKPVNFYDQDRCVWARYVNGEWSRSDTPLLTVNFAGIGTRGLNNHGLEAIKDVMAKTFVRNCINEGVH